MCLYNLIPLESLWLALGHSNLYVEREWLRKLTWANTSITIKSLSPDDDEDRLESQDKDIYKKFLREVTTEGDL